MSDYKKEKQNKDYMHALGIADSFPLEYRNYIISLYNNGRSSATILNYTYDMSVFFTWYKNYYPKYSNTPVKNIPIESFRNLNTVALNDYENYLLQYTSSNVRKRKRDISGNIEYDNAGMEIWENADMSNSLRSRKRKFSALSSFCKYLNSIGVLENNPVLLKTTAKLENPKVHIYLNTDESKSLINGIAEDKHDNLSSVSQRYKYHFKNRDYAIVVILLLTGIRISELVGIDIADINWKENYFNVIRKGHKENIDKIYFSDDVRTALLSYLNGSDIPEEVMKKLREDSFYLSCWNFTIKHGISNSFEKQIEKEFGQASGNAKKVIEDLQEYALTSQPRKDYAKPNETALFVSKFGKRISQRAVQMLIKDYIERNLIEPLKGDIQSSNDMERISKVTAHKLRTSYTVRLANGVTPVPISTLQALLGHSSSAVTSKYYISIEEEQKKSVNQNLKVNL